MPAKPKKPLIGITASLMERVQGLAHDRPVMLLAARYCTAVLQAGGVPMMLPTAKGHAAEPGEVLGKVDGLLLSGGRGVAGSAFMDNPQLTLRETDPERWDYETALVRKAMELGIPIMGICRGMQTICEALPGGRVENLRGPGDEDAGHYQDAPPGQTSHGITTAPGSRLNRAIGERALVNSFHRQAVGRVPDGFTASAHADDGHIEAMEAATDFVLGVQFHPEWIYQARPGFIKIFQGFIKRSIKSGG